MRRLDISIVPVNLFGLLITSILGTGCTGKSSHGAPKVYPVVIIAIDRSGSTDVFREGYKLAAKAATAYTADHRNLLGFYAVDRKAVSIEEPRRYQVGGLSRTVSSELETKSSNRSVGTRPLAFWQEMNERFASSKSKVYIAFLTDGGNDYADENKAVTAALKQLATNSNIHVALLGVNPDLSSSIRRDIAPFGDRGRLTIQTGNANKEALRSELMLFTGAIK